MKTIVMHAAAVALANVELETIATALKDPWKELQKQKDAK